MGDEESYLSGTAWSLDALGGAPAVEGVRSTVAFGADGRVTGRGGVNRFFGSYEASTDSIEFGNLGSTLMAGPEEAIAQEQKFLDALAGTRPYSIDGDVLTIGEARLRRVEQVEVSGRVTYRQRVALPPDAVVIVRVLDVSMADAPSVTLAERRIPVEHQVPIPFSLTVDRADLDSRHRYAVAASIEIGGELAWISDTHHPVAVDEPTEVEINLVMARS
ncbi:MAG: YbaY family lipoprotein [Acidimicrobiales bacterium]